MRDILLVARAVIHLKAFEYRRPKVPLNKTQKPKRNLNGTKNAITRVHSGISSTDRIAIALQLEPKSCRCKFTSMATAIGAVTDPGALLEINVLSARRTHEKKRSATVIAQEHHAGSGEG